MEEIYQATGNPYGGIKVNEAFEKLLRDVFGIHVVEKFRSKYPSTWLKLMLNFEQEKRGDRALKKLITRIQLPRKFMEEVRQSGEDEVDLPKRCQYYEVEISDDEDLCLSPTAMTELFEQAIHGIVSHMENLLRNLPLKGINYLIIVGGFSECTLLQHRISKAVVSSNCKLLVPNAAGIAVLKGAVTFGKLPNEVISRIMTVTYGFSTYQDFNPKVHSVEKREIVEGVAKCKDIFYIIVSMNEVVKQGDTKSFNVSPIRSDQNQVSFDFFTSSCSDPKYVTDVSVKPLTTKPLIVDSPDTSKGTSREIELRLYFGGTEIKATAIDKTSKNSKVLYLTFL